MKFVVSLVLYNISRRMNDYGIIGEAAGPGLCRRGWEWYDIYHTLHMSRADLPQDSINCLAMPLELLFWSLPALEDSYDS